MPKTRKFGRISALEATLELPKAFDLMCQGVWSSYNAMFGDMQRFDLDISESACKSYYYGHTEPRLSTGYAILQIIAALSEQEIEAARARQDAVRGITRYVG